MQRYLDWLAPRIARQDGTFSDEDVEYWRSGEQVADAVRVGA
jgi:hypothetical protein